MALACQLGQPCQDDLSHVLGPCEPGDGQRAFRRGDDVRHRGSGACPRRSGCRPLHQVVRWSRGTSRPDVSKHERGQDTVRVEPCRWRLAGGPVRHIHLALCAPAPQPPRSSAGLRDDVDDPCATRSMDTAPRSRRREAAHGVRRLQEATRQARRSTRALQGRARAIHPTRSTRSPPPAPHQQRGQSATDKIAQRDPGGPRVGPDATN